MAARIWQSIQGLVHGQIVISGSFAPAGTDAPTTVRGRGFTVARTGVGSFTVTFSDSYPELVAVTAQLQRNLPNGSDVYVGAYDASARTLVLQVLDNVNSAADVSAHANNRVNFAVFFRNSSINVIG